MTDFALPVTALTTLLLGTLYLWLTARVILMRRRDGIGLGDNGNRIMEKKIRGHANAAEQIPLGLILIGFNEAMNSTETAITLATLLVVGRVLHGVYFTLPGFHHRLRLIGMFLTLVSHILGLAGIAAGLLL